MKMKLLLQKANEEDTLTNSMNPIFFAKKIYADLLEEAGLIEILIGFKLSEWDGFVDVNHRISGLVDEKQYLDTDAVQAVPSLHDEAQRLLIILKAASTLDGFIETISSPRESIRYNNPLRKSEIKEMFLKLMNILIKLEERFEKGKITIKAEDSEAELSINRSNGQILEKQLKDIADELNKIKKEVIELNRKNNESQDKIAQFSQEVQDVSAFYKHFIKAVVENDEEAIKTNGGKIASFLKKYGSALMKSGSAALIGAASTKLLELF